MASCGVSLCAPTRRPRGDAREDGARHRTASGGVDRFGHRPIDEAGDEHIKEYETHLLAKARDGKHISETLRLIKGVVRECRYRILADLESGSEAGTTPGRREKKIGPPNRQRRSGRHAILLPVADGQGPIEKDPTRGLHRLNVEEDRRRERRALTDDEAQRLIDAAFRSTTEFKHLTGKDRSVMYTLGPRTGLAGRNSAV